MQVLGLSLKRRHQMTTQKKGGLSEKNHPLSENYHFEQTEL